MLAKNKWNSTEKIVFQALMDLEISHEKYKSIINEEENYRRLRNNIENNRTARENSVNV